MKRNHNLMLASVAAAMSRKPILVVDDVAERPPLAASMALAAILGMTGRRLRDEKTPRKCLLKDCQRTTTHNGGYCCAEHCKLDREISKISKRKEAGMA